MLPEHVLVNPAVGPLHEQVQPVLIDRGSWARRGQAVACYLAPAAPMVREHVLVNPAVGPLHEQVQPVLIDRGSWARRGQAVACYLALQWFVSTFW